MFGWWTNSPVWLQIAVAAVPLVVSTWLYFHGIVWFWGFAIGIALLLVSGRSEASKRGYHDF